MISCTQIQRLLDAQEYSRVVERILSNGRCPCGSAKRLLRQADVAAAAAFGLALQRLAELTYRPSALSQRLAEHLLPMQRHDGMFGSAELPDSHSDGDALLAATATALRGLIAWSSQHDLGRTSIDPRISDAITRGIQALANRYHADAHLKEHALGWAVVLWQLGDVPEFRRTIPSQTLLQMLRDNNAGAIEDELCRYAQAMAA